MGFFSALTGGSKSSQSSASESKSGFATLPTEIQNVYKGYATDLGTMFQGGASDSLFRPLPRTEYEDIALNTVKRGINPDRERLQSDIAMQMNPFDQHVIDTINREAGGEYSLLKTALDEAGQFGSNRHILGANDIDLTRLNLIGRFKQDAYNNALENSLNEMTKNRAIDVGLQFDAGGFLRNLDAAEKQAPISAMTTFGQLLGVLPTDGGTQSSSSSSGKSSSTNGILPALSGFF